MREDKLNAPELRRLRQRMDAVQVRVAAREQTCRQDPAALDFMLRLTSPVAITATLEAGESGAPALNMPGVHGPLCAAWVLDADTLPLPDVQTSRWDSPNLTQAAVRLRVSPAAL